MTSSNMHRGFIDQSGWEVDDPPTSLFATHANFLKNVENHTREQAIHQHRRSRYVQLYKEKLKLNKPKREPQSCEFPDLYINCPQFLTVNTLDLGGTRGRGRQNWGNTTKDCFRIHVTNTRSLELPARRGQSKDPQKYHMKESTGETEDIGKQIYLQNRQNEHIDDLASKHLSHYLKQRKEEYLRTGQRVFQLPFCK